MINENYFFNTLNIHLTNGHFNTKECIDRKLEQYL